MEEKKIDKSTLEANKYVHSFLVNKGEYQKSPHFKYENKLKVRSIIERVTKPIITRSDRKVIDFGCGTGFIIDLVKDLFDEVHGVDITPDMMKHVDTLSGNITLHESIAEKTSFNSNSFDFATAYSFMDHLKDYKIFLKEVFRVLNDGGIFYTDLNPNRSFIKVMGLLENYNSSEDFSLIVKKEIFGSLHNGRYYEDIFGMNAEMLEKAEPIKSIDKGFDARETLDVAKKIGFKKCFVEYEWFLDQSNVMHNQSLADSRKIENYLISVLPVSDVLFKYLRFIFVK